MVGVFAAGGFVGVSTTSALEIFAVLTAHSTSLQTIQ